MKVLLGLGNPGVQYAKTRHNIGFMLVDQLGTEYGAEFKSERKLKADIAKISVNGSPVLLVKPFTFMNNSGESFFEVKNWYKLNPNDFLVAHDDVSLPLGRIRLQKAGGAGGQHGVESIIETIGGDRSFDRLKVGVGPDPGGERRADYVLSRFPEPDLDLLTSSIELSVRGVKLWLDKGIQTAMNQCNGIDLTAPPPTEI